MNTIYVNVAVNKEWTSRSFVKLKNFVLQQSSTPSNWSWWDLPRLEQNKCDLVERKQVLCWEKTLNLDVIHIRYLF